MGYNDTDDRRRAAGATVRDRFDLAASYYYMGCDEMAGAAQGAAQQALWRELDIPMDIDTAAGESDRWFSFFDLYSALIWLRAGDLAKADRILANLEESFGPNRAAVLGIEQDYGTPATRDMHQLISRARRHLLRSETAQAIGLTVEAMNRQYNLAVERTGTIVPAGDTR